MFVPFSPEHPTGDVLSDNQRAAFGLAVMKVRWIYASQTDTADGCRFNGIVVTMRSGTPFRRDDLRQIKRWRAVRRSPSRRR